VSSHQKHGVLYEPSAEPKARIYERLLPLLSSRGSVCWTIPGYSVSSSRWSAARRAEGATPLMTDPGATTEVVNAAGAALIERYLARSLGHRDQVLNHRRSHVAGGGACLRG